MNLPTRVDLRSQFARFGLDPKSQGKRGTCSIFALVGVLEFEYAHSPYPASPKRLSVEYLNWASHQTNGRRVDGSFFSDALTGMQRFGICAENLLPYAPDFDPNLAPPAAAREEALSRRTMTPQWIKEWDVTTGLSEPQLLAVRRRLAEGHPVACGLRWPKNAQFVSGHCLVQPPPADVFDGHSIVLIGYTDDPRQEGGGTFLFRNSSGPVWEEGGHARFSYDYARAYANDAVSLAIGIG